MYDWEKCGGAARPLTAGGEHCTTVDDIHAQYTWLYCARPTGKNKMPMMTLEEFTQKEQRCGVRVLRVQHVDSGFLWTQSMRS